MQKYKCQGKTLRRKFLFYADRRPQGVRWRCCRKIQLQLSARHHCCLLAGVPRGLFYMASHSLRQCTWLPRPKMLFEFLSQGARVESQGCLRCALLTSQSTPVHGILLVKAQHNFNPNSNVWKQTPCLYGRSGNWEA